MKAKLGLINVSNHLSTRKLKQISVDPRYSRLQKAKARKLVLERGETVHL